MKPGQGLFLGISGHTLGSGRGGFFSWLPTCPTVNAGIDLLRACQGGTSQAFYMCPKIAQSNLAGTAAGTWLSTQPRAEVGTRTSPASKLQPLPATHIELKRFQSTHSWQLGWDWWVARRERILLNEGSIALHRALLPAVSPDGQLQGGAGTVRCETPWGRRPAGPFSEKQEAETKPPNCYRGFC